MHWARRLVRIMTPACGAGGPGFKSQRARQRFRTQFILNVPERKEGKWELPNTEGYAIARADVVSERIRVELSRF